MPGGGTSTFEFLGSSPLFIDTISISQPTCNTSNGSLTVEVVGGTNPISYSVNGGNFQTSNIITGLDAGVHTLVVVDSFGCDTSVVVYMSDIEAPVINSATSVPDDCSYTSFNLDIETTGGVMPFLYSLDGVSYQPELPNVLVTQGSIVVFIQDDLGCIAVSPIDVNSFPILAIDNFSTKSAQCGQQDGQIIITAIGGNDPYQYSLGNAPYQESNAFTGLNNGLYTVHVRDSMGCMADTTVQVKLNCDVYLPNVFTPNQDGKNDYFKAYSYAGIGFTIKRMSVYDRWGETVFHNTNFSIDSDDQLWWDGRSRGKFLDPGVYVYYMEVIDNDGVEHRYEGDVTLLK
jgi:gliding motility-associated-like protein